MFCKSCNNETENPIFCCRSCNIRYNNLQRGIRNAIYCLNCSIKIEKGHLYCSHKCHKEFDYLQRIKIWKETGKIGLPALKKYLFEKQEGKCIECNIINWNNKQITLELHHKDGNSEDDREENVCLICPNCHSQTSTYGSKNKGNGRHKRRLRYKEGKSY